MSLFPVLRMGDSQNLFSDFDNMFDMFLTSPPSGRVKNAITSPRANILMGDNSYTIELAAPGFSRGDFEIDVNNNTLTISVSSEDGLEYKRNITRREFSYSSFARSWTLPDGVYVDGISAVYNSGILSVSIPSDPQKSKARKIEVE